MNFGWFAGDTRTPEFPFRFSVKKKGVGAAAAASPAAEEKKEEAKEESDDDMGFSLFDEVVGFFFCVFV
ncbi:hypothetical protein ABFS83_09G059200 [Erythranthe nasuta]